MGMQQPSPEQIQALMAQAQGQDPNQQPQIPPGQDPALAATGGHPMAQQIDQMHPDQGAFDQVQQSANIQPDPIDILPDVVMQIMNYTLGIINDKTLDKPIQSKIIAEQSNALVQLFGVLNPPNQVDPQQQQMVMAMKQEQHQSEMQMKHEKHQTDLQIAQEKHAMELQKAQHDMQLQAVQGQQKVQQQEDTHQQKLVQGEEAHKSKIQQQKQAAQQKQSSKQGSNKGGKR
jgi:hypothetical protein